jgi:hypothetical protein
VLHEILLLWLFNTRSYKQTRMKVVLGAEPEGSQLGPTSPSEQFLYFLNTSSLTFCGKPVPRTTASVQVSKQKTKERERDKRNRENVVAFLFV